MGEFLNAFETVELYDNHALRIPVSLYDFSFAAAYQIPAVVVIDEFNNLGSEFSEQILVRDVKFRDQISSHFNTFLMVVFPNLYVF